MVLDNFGITLYSRVLSWSF